MLVYVQLNLQCKFVLIECIQLFARMTLFFIISSILQYAQMSQSVKRIYIIIRLS